MPTPDTSLYPQAPAPLKPLDLAGQAAGLVGQLNQNKLFSLNLQAREAIGPIYQRSIDPATGELDTNKLLKEAAGDPRTAFMAGQLTEEAIARKAGQIANLKSDLEFKRGQVQAVSDYMGRIGANPTKKNVTDTLADGISAGIITPQKAAELYSTLPVEDNPEKIKAWLLPHQLQNMSAMERINTLYGQLTEVDTGGQKIITRAGAITPGGPQATVFEKGLTPGEQTDQMRVWNPQTNQYEMITRAEALRRQGGSVPGASGGRGTPAAGSGAIAAEPPLGAPEAASVSAKGSAEAITGMRAQVAGSAERIYQLESALDALAKTATGPGTETRQKMQSMLSSFPGIRDLKALEGIKEDAKYYDEANKKLTQVMLGQMPGLGAGTDDKLAAMAAANPSVHISSAAAKDLTKINIGLEKYRIAQVDAFNQSGLPDEKYYRWAVDWNKEVDPRAFVVDLKDPKAREMVKKMPEAEKSRIVKTHKWAVANGYLR